MGCGRLFPWEYRKYSPHLVLGLKRAALCLHEHTLLRSVVCQLISPASAFTGQTLKPVPFDNVLDRRCDSFKGPSSGLGLHNPFTMALTPLGQCDLKSTNVSYSLDRPTVTVIAAPRTGCTAGSIYITV